MVISEEQILGDIRRVVAAQGGLRDGREVHPDDRLVDDLGLDSLTLTSLAVELEDRYRVILSDEDTTRVRTVGELMRCVAERARESS